MRSNSMYSRPVSANGRKVFIGGLSRESTDSSLKMYFENYGRVRVAEVLRDHQTMCSRGFGFVTFESEDVANTVMVTGLSDPHVIDGKQVEVKLAVPKQDSLGNVTRKNKIKRRQARNSCPNLEGLRQVQNDRFESDVSLRNPKKSPLRGPVKSERSYSSRSDSTAFSETRKGIYPYDSNGEFEVVARKIFVGGLQYSTGHERLRKFFLRYGDIVSAEVIYNRDTKKSRGFGFVVFNESISVRAVMIEQEYQKLVLDGKQIEVKLCKPKEGIIEAKTQEESMELMDRLTKDLSEFSILNEPFELHTPFREDILNLDDNDYINRYDNFSFSYDLRDNFGIFDNSF